MLYKDLIADIKELIEGLDWSSVKHKYSFGIIKNNLVWAVEEQYPWIKVDKGAEYGRNCLLKVNDIVIIQVRFKINGGFKQVQPEIEDQFKYQCKGQCRPLFERAGLYDTVTVDDVQFLTKCESACRELDSLYERRAELELKLEETTQDIEHKKRVICNLSAKMDTLKDRHPELDNR